MPTEPADRTVYGVRCDRAEWEPLRRASLAEAEGAAAAYDASDTCGPHIVLVSHDGGATWTQVTRD